MQKTSHRIIFYSAILAAICLSVFVIISLTTSGLSSAIELNQISKNDHVRGNKDSDVILIEYSDFQCPACVFYYYGTEEMLSEFEDHIQYVYRHFPLRSIHPNAQIAAQAAEAAGEQDKFWEMYDELFSNQEKWSGKSTTEAVNLFVGYAQDIGLDIKQFLEDLESEEVVDKVNADYDSAMEAGLYYTPTFILNGEIVTNPTNTEEFRSLIKNALEENNS